MVKGILVFATVIITVVAISRMYFRLPSFTTAASRSTHDDSPAQTPDDNGKSAAEVRMRRQPHILFVVADDLGWNDIGFRNDAVLTPNLDALAREGVILNQSYVQPICSPTRSCFMTGRYPIHTGVKGIIMPQQGFGLNPTLNTIANALRELGYATHMVGKWHLGFCKQAYIPTQRGFDTFYGHYLGAEDYYTHRRTVSVPAAGGQGVRKVRGYDFHRDTRDSFHSEYAADGVYSTEAFGKEAVDIIDRHDPSTPLFLYLAFQAIHGPLQVPRRYLDMYKNFKGSSDRRHVLGMLAAMDEAIGNVAQALRQNNLWDNTLVVFTTDNGGEVTHGGNNWPLRGNKGTVWEGGTRGTAFIHASWLTTKGRTYNGIIHAVDWYPTLIAAAGGGDSGGSGNIKDGMGIDGLDMWSALQDNRTSPRTGFVYNIDPDSNTFAIRVGRYKYIKSNAGLRGKN
eukprot:scpid60590/ scgid4143/ Arylsulfatase B; N-acetylgalactosamine-4-sulfatase